MKYVKKYKFIVLIVLIFFILVGSYFKSVRIGDEIVEASENVEDVEIDDELIENNLMLVDIKGAIANPGVYEMANDSRVIDVINLSGGLLENADTNNINLSKKVFDEMVIIIDFKEEKEVNDIFVDIKGAVKKTGVYKLKEGSRIIDVVNVSGGLLENADISNINLSEKICDEMSIYIKTKDESKDIIEDDCSIGNEKTEDSKEEIKNDASIEREEMNNKEESNSKISLNKATKEQLMTLPGIGESKALDIIEYRNNKLFENIEEIMNIKGIGNSIYEKIKEYITI